MLDSSDIQFSTLKRYINSCDICSGSLPYSPKQITAVSEKSRILVIGSTPGLHAHETGKLWDDENGEILRSWFNVSDEEFFSTDNFAFLPMGFCYSGKEANRNHPPRPECAPLWHNLLVHSLKNVRLTILLGQYSQSFYLNGKSKSNTTENVKSFKEYLPEYFILPYPSCDNASWERENNWFTTEVLPELRTRIKKILS